MRNKVYNYLNSFLLLSRMSKLTRNKVSYNVDEALDYLLESDEELGSLNMKTMVIVAIIPNIMMLITLFQLQLWFFIPGVDQDASQVEFVVQEERPKRKTNIGPVMSLNTSLDKTNYDAFDPLISK